MTNIFRNPIDLHKACKERKVLKGYLSLHLLEKLSDKLMELKGELFVELSFDFVEQNRHFCKGFIQGKLPLECQRSLERYDFEVNQHFNVVISDSIQQLKQIENEYETFLVDGCVLAPIDLIEEEILLLLPLVPKKPLKDCKIDKSSAYYDAFSEIETKEGSDKRENPFAILSKLKKH